MTRPTGTYLSARARRRHFWWGVRDGFALGPLWRAIGRWLAARRERLAAYNAAETARRRERHRAYRS